MTLLFAASCQRKQGSSKKQQLLLKQCDELNIVYYSNDTFVFKTFDTSSIKNYTELITYQNENNIDTCEVTEKLTSQQRLPAGTLRFGFLKSEVYYPTSGKGLDIAAKFVPRTIIKSPLVLWREYYYCGLLIACAPPKQMPKNSFNSSMQTIAALRLCF